MRSTRVADAGSSGCVTEAWKNTVGSRMTAPAVQGAGQSAGYFDADATVVLRIAVKVRVLDGLSLLWNDALNWMPYAIGYDPASLSCLLNGMLFSRSSQKR